MNVADDPVVAALNEVVRSDSAAAIIGMTLQRVLRQLDASAKLMAWETVPLSAFAGGLPESIRSCWIFVIRAGADTGAERHPNSHQRSFSLIGSGTFELRPGTNWHSHPLNKYGPCEYRTAVGEHSAVNLAPALRGIRSLGNAVLSHGRSRGADRGETGGHRRSRRRDASGALHGQTMNHGMRSDSIEQGLVGCELGVSLLEWRDTLRIGVDLFPALPVARVVTANLRSHLPIRVSRGAKPHSLCGEWTLRFAGRRHRLRETPDGVRQLGFTIARKSKPNVRRRLAIEEESVAGFEDDALCRCKPTPLLQIDVANHPNPHGGPAGRQRQAHGVSQLVRQQRGRRIATRMVDAAHPPHVPLDLTVFKQLRNRRLEHLVSMRIQERAVLGQVGNHTFGGGNVAETQPGGERLRQAADVDDVPCAVGARQRQDGTTVVMKLVVVIVLDNREAMLARELEQTQAARR